VWFDNKQKRYIGAILLKNAANLKYHAIQSRGSVSGNTLYVIGQLRHCEAKNNDKNIRFATFTLWYKTKGFNAKHYSIGQALYKSARADWLFF